MFGVDKARRVGEHTCEEYGLNLNIREDDYSPTMLSDVARDRTEQRGLMDVILYDIDNLMQYVGPGGRIVVIAFMRAAGIFLTRLLECGQRRSSFAPIVIVCLPWGDNISRAGGGDEVAKYLEATGVQVTGLTKFCSVSLLLRELNGGDYCYRTSFYVMWCSLVAAVQVMGRLSLCLLAIRGRRHRCAVCVCRWTRGT